MDMDQALQTFILECHELLDDMENALLSVEQLGPEADGKGEMINAIFRAAHTIKGSAGLFGLDQIVAFTHVVESVLDEVRADKISIDEQLVVLLLSCCDQIAKLVASVEAGEAQADAELVAAGAPLIEALRRYLAPASAAVSLAAAPHGVERIASEGAEADVWHISLRFGADVLRNGMDPLSFLRYLGRLGRIAGIVTIHDAMPAALQMDAETCYLGFEIALASSADKAAIENVFEFVRDDCQLRILPPHSRISEYLRLIQEMPAEAARLGDMLVACGTITRQELGAALATQGKDEASQPIGAILVGQGTVERVVVDAALAKQKQVVEQKALENRSIRIDADKLDHLINLVGELIIAGASVSLIARRSHNAELAESTSTLSSLVEEVRDSTLQLRMVKIGATFNRFQRVVHDVAREIGKDIRLLVSGEETELDKTVVEKIADPLTHLIRNALDHGIEPAELRAARGKPVQGSVRLNAFHDAGHIVIEVSDDGGGLKRDKIMAKAVERGLVEPGRVLSEREIYGLIFEPGFSTAEQVTKLSGRGVGMDVVKRNITALRGSVEVDSREGEGTTVSVRLPLTLAIIDGFLVEVGKAVYVIPLEMIDECVEFSADAGHDYTSLRGQVLPFIRLRELFGVEGQATRRENIVVVRHGTRKVGLVVDTLLGEFQTVIKPLAKMFNRVACISGSTILGSGELALIVDVAALLRNVEGRAAQQLAA
jgi:two-component system, chemotaxis family, sensor kinase CheA